MRLLLPLLLASAYCQDEKPRTVKLLKKDLESLSCLFFRRNCANHLTDLSAANRLFWKVMTRPAAAQPKELEKNTVTLEVYMESQCPDTTRFMHKQMMTAWEKLGATGRVDLTIVPFGKARCVEKGQDFECQCQHGPTECVLNQLMNCVIDRIGFPDKYLPVVNCIQGQRGLDGAMSACIAGHSILNEKQTRECAEGARGRRLLAMAGARTAGLSPALTFVPWITLNGVREPDALYDLTENLCKKMQPAPEQCAGYKL